MKAKVIRDISPVLKVGDILTLRDITVMPCQTPLHVYTIKEGSVTANKLQFYVKEGEDFRKRTGNTPPNGYPKQQVEAMTGWFEILK